MTIKDTQTILQPELVNQLERKISYLRDLQSAIKNNQISEVYQLIDLHKFNDRFKNISSETYMAQLDYLVVDIKKDIAAFLAPELINYIVTNFDFLTLEPVADNATLYDVYLGDWWDHRQLGTLNVLTVTLTGNDAIISELLETSELPVTETINTTKIQEVKKVIAGLESFLADNTKRSLELQVIEDQLSEMATNKSGLFGRSDKVTREALEKKQELLVATQKRVPEVEEKLNKQQAYLLRFEKEDTLRQLELQAILAHFVDVPTFITELQHIYMSYMAKLDQK
ncbi:hydrolase [Leuconostoc gasicomitatum]|uniref:hydrolase n=1 Tax=Leuconostoc gasicomitatum TaxID=115778 RepID=UPI0015CAF47F|nr:hydrolase [Leuconostoc gasicomitatum]QLG78809.1 hydrolase [Leuconostoc gasicomitatum]